MQNGIYEDKLLAHYNDLKRGYTPCRCERVGRRLPKQEVEFLLKVMCEQLGFTFIGFAEEFKGMETKIIYTLEDGTIKDRSAVRFFLNKYKYVKESIEKEKEYDQY